MFKKKEFIFNIRKVNDKDGIYIRESPDLDSPKVIDDKIPNNSLIAVAVPLNIVEKSNKSRVEILRPVKGWVFLDDLVSLDYLEYLNYGKKYETILNEQIKSMGKDKFKNQNYLLNSDTVQVYTIKKEEDKENDLIKLTNFNSVLKDLESKKNLDENFNIEETLCLEDFHKKIPHFKKPLIIYFGASWCGPCINFKPKLIKAVKKIGGIKLYIIDSDKDSELVEEFKIDRIPKLYYIKEGKIIDEITGATEDLKLLEKSLTNFKENFDSEKDKDKNKNNDESELSNSDLESIEIDQINLKEKTKKSIKKSPASIKKSPKSIKNKHNSIKKK